MQFTPCTPYCWKYNYEKPTGKEAVFHVQTNKDLRIVQNFRNNTFIFFAENTYPLLKLTYAVADLKKKLSFNHSPAGAFCINEFGKVIVPVFQANGYIEKYVIGTWEGTICFKDGYGSVFSLDENIPVGQVWPYPYLGMKYHLSKVNRIYYMQSDITGQRPVFLDNVQPDLVRNLRAIRRDNKPATFLVNPYGIVLIKRDPYKDNTAYVAGKIDKNMWFNFQ